MKETGLTICSPLPTFHDHFMCCIPCVSGIERDTKSVMQSGDVISLFQALESKGISIWIDGSWGVDALERDHIVGGIRYPDASLTGQGMIDGSPVRCIAAEHLVKFHSGYPLRRSDDQDVRALCEKFGIPVPYEHRMPPAIERS